MSLHQKHKNKLPDSCFEKGTLQYIVPGNKGRVLDGRRTPGFIEKYDHESAMFIWRITDFEDKGRHWEIPAEKISSYQFEKNSEKLTGKEAKDIEKRCEFFAEKLVITALQSEYEKTKKLLQVKKDKAQDWFRKESQFAGLGKSQLNIQASKGSQLLYKDLTAFLAICQVLDLERKTANQYLLNPYSGEWIKGLKIVMAEMGLIDFNEKRPRTVDIFKGIGSKEKRKKYIVARLAFLQTFFGLAGYKEVQLFRGMATEGKPHETPRTLISATFNPEVAKEFSCIDRNNKVTFSYLVKFTYPIENLFMTFLETEAFNKRYQEQEAVVLYRDKLWRDHTD